MPRGGPRPGSGRKRGQRTNTRRLAAKRISKDGKELPLDYMIAVMRDPRVPTKRRDKMAKECAPYFHARLASVVHQGDPNKPIEHKVSVEFV